MSANLLLVWLAKRDDSPEIDAHGKEALNFQISMLIYNLVAAIQASDGKFYRYPMTIRFIQ